MASRLRSVRILSWSLIGCNLLVFAKWHLVPTKPGSSQMQQRQQAAAHQYHMLENYTISQRNIEQGRYKTLLTSAFSHKDIGHLAVNMFMLHQSCSIAAMVGLGPVRVGALALGSALAGSAGSLYDAKAMTKKGGPDTHGLGASGMVQGMLVGTMMAVPRLPMNLMFIPIPVAYRTLVLGFLGWDMYKLYEQRTSGRHKENWHGSFVGYAAHLGGAAFGAVFYALSMRRGRLPPLR
ncbi:hypothetical protein F5Y18DRAFT_400372 [Xylariaceae sp. FL1019]|nr:hypothetical protein F5Y18DRAFT_400372 [Xylariaceae sp. FL1019]